MPFKTIENLKLGNMRKGVQWVFSPTANSEPDVYIIQSDARIAQINVKTGAGVLSSGKGGHPGFMMLHPSMGSVQITVPEADLVRLREVAGTNYGLKPHQAISLTTGQVVDTR